MGIALSKNWLTKPCLIWYNISRGGSQDRWTVRLKTRRPKGFLPAGLYNMRNLIDWFFNLVGIILLAFFIGVAVGRFCF